MQTSFFFDTLQLIGGIILALGYIPQIKQIIKTKSVGDLNFRTFSMVLLGIFLMELYAVHLFLQGTGQAFLVTNTLALLLQGTMVSLIIKYKPKDNPYSTNNDSYDSKFQH